MIDDAPVSKQPLVVSGARTQKVVLHKFLNSPRIPAMPDLDALLHNPALHDYLAIIKGARNGFVYGVKVRFPHALIMAILFGRGEYVRLYSPFSRLLIFAS